jgi:15-cis-phytoene synthase
MTADHELRDSHDFCRRIARREAKNFYPAFLLLPADRRRAMCALYAFMRQSDDIADEPGAIEPKRAALSQWREDLDAALAGEPRAWPGWRALSQAVLDYKVPPHSLHDVIDGVMMDLEPRPFASHDELRDYCDHVASAVGICCIHIWGFRSDGGRAEALAHACGQALQLTNILRDVGEDARNARIYLPQDGLARFGVREEDLLAPRVGAPLRALLAHEARRAYEEYDRAEPLAELIDPVGRPVLRAIVGIYRALLDEIARRDFEVLADRISVPRWRKAMIALGAIGGRFSRRSPWGVEAGALK